MSTNFRKGHAFKDNVITREEISTAVRNILHNKYHNSAYALAKDIREKEGSYCSTCCIGSMASSISRWIRKVTKPKEASLKRLMEVAGVSSIEELKQVQKETSYESTYKHCYNQEATLPPLIQTHLLQVNSMHKGSIIADCKPLL